VPAVQTGVDNVDVRLFSHEFSFILIVIVGQSELLLNFACSARARGFDISNVLVFATDEETKELAESVGMTSYFDHRVRTKKLLLMCNSFNQATTLTSLYYLDNSELW